LDVAEALQAWLSVGPEGCSPMGSPGAKSAIKAFVDGWSSSVLRALAARPLTLTELNALIKSVNYPSLERRLAAMRFAGLVAHGSSGPKGTPYAITQWLRLGVAPLVLAANWEARHLQSRAASLSTRDAEAIFLLSVPLMSLPGDLSGSFRFAMELRSDSDRRLAGVRGQTSEGRVSALTSQLNGDAEATAVGPPGAWLSALCSGDAESLELGGDRDSVRKLFASLRRGLFGQTDTHVLPERALASVRPA
jgi:DNA-binding HxlR family transcriptional regulator